MSNNDDSPEAGGACSWLAVAGWAKPDPPKAAREIPERLPENVPGKYFTDDKCLDCDACRATAPDNFRRHDEKGYSYVYQQPRNALEEKLCREALEGCGVEAVRDDGA